MVKRPWRGARWVAMSSSRIADGRTGSSHRSPNTTGNSYGAGEPMFRAFQRPWSSYGLSAMVAVTKRVGRVTRLTNPLAACIGRHLGIRFCGPPAGSAGGGADLP
jgi:hypothetical protein